MATNDVNERIETVQEAVENANRPNATPSNSATHTADAKVLAGKVSRPTIPQRKRNNDLDKRKDSTGNIPTS